MRREKTIFMNKIVVREIPLGPSLWSALNTSFFILFIYANIVCFFLLARVIYYSYQDFKGENNVGTSHNRRNN